MLTEQEQELLRLIENSSKIVFFGGAGVSTESGIPDFRSQDGLYSQKFAYPPEVMVSASFFHNHTEEFYRFYKEKMMVLNALPNGAHTTLKRLEDQGKMLAVITQNIDGLHTKAGSKQVIELHGSIYRNYCLRCHKKYTAQYVYEYKGVPLCSCGGVIKPDVVLYEEGLNQKDLEKSVTAIEQADLLIIGGTSLLVYPAAGLIEYYTGNKLVIINKSPTKQDSRADLLFAQPIGELLEKVWK